MDKLFPPNIRTGIVIPTLGNRPEYIQKCIASTQTNNKCQIVVVIPPKVKLENSHEFIPSVIIVDDPGKGLAEAINIGISALPKSIEFCSWIGDDDLLEPGSVEECEAILDADSEAVMVFGRCKYITSDGELIGINKSGHWAVPLLRIGPCLIPQPGSLFRRKVFDEIGGLDTKFGWAFDFDLFIRLSKIGKLVHTKKVLACFRWHSDSLTVGQRRNSVREASLVRREHLPKWLVLVSFFWEIPVKFFTMHAGRLVAHKAFKILGH